MSTSTSARDGHDGHRPGRSGRGPRKAGAFDIRSFIGTLLGLYGVILTLMGLLGDKELAKTGGINANLWVGLALLVVSAVFLGWAKARPMIVPDHVEQTGEDAGHGGH
ncbi:hypothetical protein [Arsenicicoccus dermatophilus]|uniref:hypothetical protein n=1 Tax=Arsenicicoccus dermatophilus TaxID=1076331 RepID=UPI001F4CF501|nr:hypothetical protein [Arsenicicoccus dermatophilus]MCH8611759.1 hypothetical protein [Arsenicicoccus dermatophilus]